MTGSRVDDVGLTVPDIEVAASRVTAAGATLLTTPAPMRGPGRMWMYCRLPWDGLLELGSRP